MRLVAAAAAIGLLLVVGATLAAAAGSARAGPAGTPDCPASAAGHALDDPGGKAVQGDPKTSAEVTCYYSGPGGEYIIDVSWVAKGDTSDHALYECGAAAGKGTIVSKNYRAWAEWNRMDVADLPAAAAALLKAVEGSFAQPCVASKPSGGTVRSECPQRKPVIKESDKVAERLTFAASHKGTPALTVNGAANLKSFYCFYKDGDHDRVGSAAGSGAIVQTAPHAVSIGFTLGGFPKSAVRGGTITDTVTGRVTTVSASSTCKVGATIVFTIVKTRTASRVSFAIGGGCGGYAFSAAESSVTLD